MQNKKSHFLLFILILWGGERNYSQNQDLKIIVYASKAKEKPNNDLIFNILIRNKSKKVIKVKKDFIIASNKFSEADIGFEIRRIQNNNEIDWAGKCFDMDIDPILPLDKSRYDTLLTNMSKQVFANVKSDCEWDKGIYKIRFVFHLNDYFSPSKSNEIYFSNWVCFEYL